MAASEFLYGTHSGWFIIARSFGRSFNGVSFDDRSFATFWVRKILANPKLPISMIGT